MDELAQIFKIFSDKNRLRILSLLFNRKMCVCELAFVLGVTQPSISRHLKKMKKAGIIQDEKDGFWTNYILCCNDSKTKIILDYLKNWVLRDCVAMSDLAKLKTIDRKMIFCK